MTTEQSTKAALDAIFLGIEMLKKTYENKRMFTVDGRLVGDIGEVIAERDYELELDKKSKAKHDGTTSQGIRVQIKATFQSHLTYKGEEGLYLGLRLNRDGSYDEIFNGPAKLIGKHFSERSGINEKLLRFPVKDLLEIQKKVKKSEMVKRRG